MNELRQPSTNINSPGNPNCALYLLGSVRLCLQDGTQIDRADWPDEQQLALFVYLVLNRDHIVTKKELQTQFCPSLPATDANNLITAVSQTLSRIFNLPNPILRLEEGYQLLAGLTFWIDINEFDRLLAQAANEPNDARQAQLLQQAISLYRDDFLQDLLFSQKWIASWRVHFRQGYLTALQKLSALYEQAGDLESARQIYLNALKARPVSVAHGRSFIHLVEKDSSPIQSLRQCKRLIALLQNELDILLQEYDHPLDETALPADRSQEGRKE